MMKDFEGVIDSLELAIVNGKGIDHKLHLLQDLKDIHQALKDKYKQGFEDGKRDMWSSIYDPSYKKNDDFYLSDEVIKCLDDRLDDK